MNSNSLIITNGKRQVRHSSGTSTHGDNPTFIPFSHHSVKFSTSGNSYLNRNANSESKRLQKQKTTICPPHATVYIAKGVSLMNTRLHTATAVMNIRLNINLTDLGETSLETSQKPLSNIWERSFFRLHGKQVATKFSFEKRENP